VGIALAGGGPLGGIYEIGALLALEEALNGVRLTECDVYVGVSSGAFVVAGLANGISPREMHAMFILDRSHSDPFERDLLLRPAFGEFARRLMRMPELGGGLRLFRGARPFRIVRSSDARPAERPSGFEMSPSIGVTRSASAPQNSLRPALNSGVGL